MILQKFTAIFLAVVLVTGAITLGTSVLVDDAFANTKRIMIRAIKEIKKNRNKYSDYDYKVKKYNSFELTEYSKNNN